MLVITGTIAYDYIMDFPGKFSDHILPNQLHNINLSFIVNKFDKRRGGTAGNVSYTLGLLNTKNTLFSVAGKDFADYKAVLEKLPINMEHVVENQDAYTATGFAMTDNNNNQIWGYFYGAADAIANLQIKDAATPSDLVVIGPSGAKGSMNLLRQCVEQQIPYMFDPGFILTQIVREELSFGIEHAAYVVGNDYEISVIKERVDGWKEMFKEKVIISTYGEKGSLIEANGKIYKIDAVKPTQVVDPTGAGDAWRAGFLAGIERKLDLQTCGEMGATAASFAVEQYGTQEHSFDMPTFQERYKSNFGSSISL